MISESQRLVAGRLRSALQTFQAAQDLRYAISRKLQGLPTQEIEAFWLMPSGRIERHVQTVATDVDATFQAFSSLGLIANTADQHLVTEARRQLTGDTPGLSHLEFAELGEEAG